MVNGAELNRHAAREECRVVDIEVAEAVRPENGPGATRQEL
jgi:hypothetical protein